MAAYAWLAAPVYEAIGLEVPVAEPVTGEPEPVGATGAGAVPLLDG